MSFSLYREQQGGVPLWTEIQNIHFDEQGRYSVLLGSTQGEGLPIDLFSSGESRWLGVQAQIQGEEELPRILLASVPYALHAVDADTIGGKPASAFLLAPPDGQFDSHAANAQPARSAMKGGDSPGMFALSGTGTLNHLAKWTDSMGTLGDSVIVESGTGITATIPDPGCSPTPCVDPDVAFDVVGHGNHLTQLELKNRVNGDRAQSYLTVWSADDVHTGDDALMNGYTAVGSTSSGYTASSSNHGITGNAGYLILARD